MTDDTTHSALKAFRHHFKGEMVHIAPDIDEEGNVRTPGFRVTCAGMPGADGNLVRHTIGHFVRKEGAVDAKGKPIDFIALSNKEHDAQWVLDTTQSGFDFDNPVCKVCGRPVSL